MNILPHHVAGTLLLGGLTIGGYFAIGAFTPPTLESKLSTLNLTLASSGWTEKAKEYVKKSNANLITSIARTKPESEVSQALENWCEKKKKKYFLGNTDITYKNFSIWCTVTKSIKSVLDGRGLKVLDQTGWTQKLNNYNADSNTQKFIDPAGKSITEDKLKQWCRETQERTNYTYEEDDTLNKILTWCYANS